MCRDRFCEDWKSGRLCEVTEYSYSLGCTDFVLNHDTEVEIGTKIGLEEIELFTMVIGE